ncbi:helix-turn-helix transcriptional regulator [Radiobacillus deserti]|uniref:Helix-turn-helix domain-containing protein n=1 Tax=Radiobacillus deserti TaxID=2594883 RepID=A0A516KGI9_9BACI|nr:helix-turn-helix domain-containing protein [Radiobacillus deserti]QDP40497.1 helix-turn-helix domain-containing protein [Radiobacillus deserti]
MEREELMHIISSKMKLIRVEQGYTQSDMATVLGISKKTLVQIEKERIIANWTTVIAICLLFRESEIIRGIIGNDVLGYFNVYLQSVNSQP